MGRLSNLGIFVAGLMLPAVILALVTADSIGNVWMTATPDLVTCIGGVTCASATIEVVDDRGTSGCRSANDTWRTRCPTGSNCAAVAAEIGGDCQGSNCRSTEATSGRSCDPRCGAEMIDECSGPGYRSSAVETMRECPSILCRSTDDRLVIAAGDIRLESLRIG
jgi:hypothetical protein